MKWRTAVAAFIFACDHPGCDCQDVPRAIFMPKNDYRPLWITLGVLTIAAKAMIVAEIRGC